MLVYRKNEIILKRFFTVIFVAYSIAYLVTWGSILAENTKAVTLMIVFYAVLLTIELY
jgi:hypothetical protein